MLDKNSGLKQSYVLLEKPLINVSCPDQIEAIKSDIFHAILYLIQ